MNAALNLGITNFPVINLDSYTMNKLMSSQIWQGYLATDNSGTTWVLDGGSKHALPSQYQSSWVGSNTPTALGDDYLSLLPTAQPLSNVIHSASNPTYYGMVGGQRFAFTSLQSYKSSGLPSPIEVSESLLQSIAFGGTWPQ
jgi:hypothetical protein